MTRFGRLAVLVLTLALLPQTASAGAWRKSLPEAQAEAKRTNRLILVDMFAEWCGWCHRMEQEVFPSEKFQAIAKNYVLLRLDTEDGKEGTMMARALEVSSLPTFVMLTPDLTVAAFIRGYSPTDQFVERIQGGEAQYFAFRKRVRSVSTSSPERERFDLARELVDRRAFSEAEPLLATLTKSGNSAVRDESYYLLATCQSAQGKYDVSKQTIKSGLGANSRGPYAEQNQFLLAKILMSERKYPAALAEFKRFKTKYPGSQMIPSVDALLPQLEQATAKK